MKSVRMLPVTENIEIAEGIFSMKLYSPEFAARVKPGQFFHIRCGGEKFPLLRRPISLAFTMPEEESFVMVYRVEGQGTAYLSGLEQGDRLDVMGPLGRGFHVDRGLRKVAMVGGGMGIAPLVELAGVYGNRAEVFLGYRDTPFLLQEMSHRTGNIYISTETGTAGHKGYITDLLPGQLGKMQPDMVYCCGPGPMMKKTVEICRQLGLKCQVSLEERMGCGIGACLVCSCATRDEKGMKTYSRVCRDGPVFWAEEVLMDD